LKILFQENKKVYRKTRIARLNKEEKYLENVKGNYIYTERETAMIVNMQ